MLVRRKAIALLLFACACGDSPDLRVDLLTDLVPGFEFQVLEVDLYPSRPTLGGDDAVGVERLRAGFFDTRTDLTAGTTLGSFVGISDGEWWVVARFFSPQGDVVASQVLAVQVRGDTAITIRFTRDCVDVECPTDDPVLEACLRGECVDPRCFQDASFCPDTECVTDLDCDSFDGFALAECAQLVCSDNLCFASGSMDGCAAGETCHPTLGCGVLRIGDDAGSIDGGVGDVGVGDGCRSVVCTPPNECELGAIDCMSGLCEAVGTVFDGQPCTGGVCMAGACMSIDPMMGVLMVMPEPPDGGTITTTDGLINCLPDCDEVLPLGTMVELTAVPTPGNRLMGWAGDPCVPTSMDTCTVTVAEFNFVQALFEPAPLVPFELMIVPPDSGAVQVMINGMPPMMGGPPFCNTNLCVYPYNEGDAFVLTAMPATGTFSHWMGLCEPSTATVCAAIAMETPAQLGMATAVFLPGT